MKTQALITLLSTGPDVAVRRPPVSASLGGAALLGGAVLSSAALTLALLGPLPHLMQVAGGAPWLLKLLCLGLLAAGGAAAVTSLSVPGRRPRALPWMAGAPLLLLWTLAAATLSMAAPEQRAALFWGHTWRYCAPLIVLLSLPILAAVLALLRRRAPTRLRLAGAAAGLLSGALAAMVYCLHCPELALGFVGVWYVLGILASSAVGAALGRPVLAW